MEWGRNSGFLVVFVTMRYLEEKYISEYGLKKC